MNKSITHLCVFTTGIDEMPRKDQSSISKVLGVLAKSTRFSVFEVTANPDIAKTMEDIEEAGYIKRKGGGYPWCKYEMTQKGKDFLERENKRQ